MGQMIQDSGWRIPDALWGRVGVVLPPPPGHPLGCHNPRAPDRAAMDAIFFVLRTGSQWGALSATGICSKSSAHRRFTGEAGVFHEFWRLGLLSYDGLVGIDWEWLSGSLQESDRYVRQIGTDTNASHAARSDSLFLSSRSSPGPGRSPRVPGVVAGERQMLPPE